MIHINKFGFILILILISYDTIAQSTVNDLREANMNVKISLTDIVGNWYALDSSQSMISFINDNDYYVHIDGIKHGVGHYSFNLDRDSLSVNGTAANWPPYNCTLRLLNSKLLEIEFYNFFSTQTSKIIYKR